jgi:peptidoglycan-N-acetylglucosamine deacetylase
VPNGVYAVAVHPQIIGEPHHMLFFERLTEYIAGKDGVWFTTCEGIAKAWVDDDTDTAGLGDPDVRGVEPAPADSGWGR